MQRRRRAGPRRLGAPASRGRSSAALQARLRPRHRRTPRARARRGGGSRACRRTPRAPRAASAGSPLRAERRDRGLAHERIGVRGRGARERRRSRARVGRGMLADRVRGGLGDPRVVVGEQREQRPRTVAARPSFGATSAARRRTRASASAAARRQTGALDPAGRGPDERGDRDRAHARVGVVEWPRRRACGVALDGDGRGPGVASTAATLSVDVATARRRLPIGDWLQPCRAGRCRRPSCDGAGVGAGRTPAAGVDVGAVRASVSRTGRRRPIRSASPPAIGRASAAQAATRPS